MSAHIDLRSYADELLTLLESHIPSWQPAIAAERARRAEQQRIWNSAGTLAAQLRQAQELRWQQGYSPNEEARGVDEREADDWQQVRTRIHFLRQRALRRLIRRHHCRSRGPR